MPADQYRQRAFEARQRGAQASDSSIKAGWERVAHEWMALADQVELLFARRYGKLDPAEAIPHPSQIIQQQQQVQRKKDDDKQK